MVIQNKSSEGEPGVNRAMIPVSSQSMERTRKVGLDLGLLETSEQEELKSWSEKAPVWGVCLCGQRVPGTEGA